MADLSGENENILDELGQYLYIADMETYELLFMSKAAMRELGCSSYRGRKCYEAMQNRNSPCSFCNNSMLKSGEVFCWDHRNGITGRFYQLQDRLIVYHGRRARLESAFDVTERENRQQELKNIVGAEERLAGTIQMINGGGSIGSRINAALKDIGDYFEADRAYLFGADPGGTAMSNTYEWCRAGISPQIGNLQHRDISLIDRWMPAFRNAEAVITPDIEAIRQSMPDEYVLMSQQGIRSYMEAPLFQNKTFSGFLGIDNPSAEKILRSGKLLLSVAYSISGALTQEQDRRRLIDSQRRYELAVESAELGVWEYDIRRHRITSPSGSFKKFGIPDVIENVPESILPLFPAEEREKLKRLFRTIESGEPRAEEDFWMIWKPGAPPRCEHVIYSVVRDENGVPDIAYGVGMNVTDRKLEQEKYRKSLHAILSANPNALCTFRLNLTDNTCSDEHGTSPYIQNLLRGSTADELFGNIASIITDADDAALFRAQFSRQKILSDFANGKTQCSLGYHRRVENGETHWVTTYANLLRNPETGSVEAVIYSVDMEREEKEEKVISAITNREYDYIALIDVKSGQINYQYTAPKALSSVYLKMGDYDAVMREALGVMVAPDELEECLAGVSFARVTGVLAEKEEYSYTFLCSGEKGAACRKQLLFRYLDEKQTEILFSRSDITEAFRQEQERAEKLHKALLEARHASAMKTEFLSNVSHDMRTPLNAVLGYTSLALQSGSPDAMTDYLQKISRAGTVLLSLINDTLDLSRIETGTVILKPAPIRCGDIIGRIISSVRPAMDEKKIRFVLDNSRAVMATINVDALRLQEIIINLLSNAVKFTPAGGEITLSVECVEYGPSTIRDCIVVRDNGCGMSRSFLPKVFEPFAQERQPETVNVGGSGLGLSIVKRLVDLMGGTISVKSELGFGTEFTLLFDFERADGSPAPHGTSGAPQERLKGMRVLLCEDNAMNTEIAKTLLGQKGISVVCAENGKAGCDLYSASAPGFFDAVLMDIRMPVMDGREAAGKIRSSGRADSLEIPIIALSADAYDDDVKKSLEAGMNGHIAKPLDPEKLFSELARLCTGRKREEP